MQRLSLTICLAGAIAIGTAPVSASDVPGDVQRLQQERDQRQMELHLKMQQQQERATRPAPGPAVDAQWRELERDQQQRQQQLHEQQSRGAMTPGQDSGEPMRRDFERQRAAQAAAEQSKRFESERAAGDAQPPR